MSPLAPNLFKRRFADLMEIGRARLPAEVSGWTDFNAHDPGITLMELLAWVAEAQLYSLSRVRRDERTAYAALLGIAPSGTESATGSIWPDRLDPQSPFKMFAKTTVIPSDANINVVGSEDPAFTPSNALLWVPGEIKKLETIWLRRRIDHTVNNARGTVPFMPFGDRASRRDTLAITFACRDRLGLFGGVRRQATGAMWAIGVRVVPPIGSAGQVVAPGKKQRSALTATFVTDAQRFPVRIESDSTEGFLQTGVLLLDLADIKSSPSEFTIELRSQIGFARPPCVLQIEANVIPIEQGRTIRDEQHDSIGSPDWNFKLDVPGLRFKSGDEPLSIEIAEPTGVTTWSRVDSLLERGPDDNVFYLDFENGELTFGNGINGRVPPADSKTFVTYLVSDGEEGNVSRNRKWSVAGFAGTFGVNPDPLTGGSAVSGWKEQRREARRRSRDDHPLVSAADIAAAAMRIPLLEVARAWVVKPAANEPRTGVVNLVALRRRADKNEPDNPPETTLWLDAIRRHLAPHMPLGVRLTVTAPRYREFFIHAVLATDAGRKPDDVEKEVRKQLGRRLAPIAASNRDDARQPGVPVTSRDVGAWIRATEGVRRVIQLQLLGSNGKATDQIDVPRSGLPRWIDGPESSIEVKRMGMGGSNVR